MNIYIFKNEQQYGPYTVEQLREYVQQGHFTLEDYACGDGQNWIPLSQIPGFAPQAQAGQPQQAAQPQAERAGAQVPQAKVAGASGGASKKKKIILFSSIGVVSLAAIITGLVLGLVVTMKRVTRLRIRVSRKRLQIRKTTKEVMTREEVRERTIKIRRPSNPPEKAPRLLPTFR